MDSRELDRLKPWFTAYCRTFSTPNADDQRNLDLKEHHTYLVCRNMERLAQELGLDERTTALAGAVALFHDIGRFAQYRQYRTFRDDISVNHAAVSAKVLIENGVLHGLSKNEQDLVVHAVTLHNVFTIPPGLDPETLQLVRMIRDADKLDIWRVFAEYYHQPQEVRAEAAVLGLPDTPAYSSEILGALLRGELARLSSLTTLNDFKLLQLAWVFDLNYTPSLRMLEERKYVETIASTLPEDEAIQQAVGSVRNYIGRRLDERA